MKKYLFLLSVLSLITACATKKIHTYEGYINGLDDSQAVVFFADAGNHLTVTLTAPDTANLRINQLISPSGVSDGPFGRTLEYDLNETGNWQLIIGGSLMQGDNYAGGFTVNWQLK